MNEKTEKIYENSKRHLLRFNEDLNALDINEYISERVLGGASPATINLDLKVLRMLTGRKIKLLPVSFRLRFCSDEEISLLIQKADHELRLAIRIAIYTGLRKSNVFALKWNDLHDEYLTVIVKGNKQIYIPIHPELKEYLSRYRRENLLIYPEIFPFKHDWDRRFRRLADSLGMEDVVFHTLRHTFISKLVMAGVDLRTVQELAGHASMRTTERYMHISTAHKQEKIKELRYGNNL